MTAYLEISDAIIYLGTLHYESNNLNNLQKILKPQTGLFLIQRAGGKFRQHTLLSLASRLTKTALWLCFRVCHFYYSIGGGFRNAFFSDLSRFFFNLFSIAALDFFNGFRFLGITKAFLTNSKNFSTASSLFFNCVL